MKTRAHVIVTGKVQGVFYRAETASKAKQLSLTGWVRNLPEAAWKRSSREKKST